MQSNKPLLIISEDVEVRLSPPDRQRDARRSPSPESGRRRWRQAQRMLEGHRDPHRQSSPRSWVSSWRTPSSTSSVEPEGRHHEGQHHRRRRSEDQGRIKDAPSSRRRLGLRPREAAGRLAKLAGGVAVIRSAPLPGRAQEKKHRVEDALSATRAAREDRAGGVALCARGCLTYSTRWRVAEDRADIHPDAREPMRGR